MNSNQIIIFASGSGSNAENIVNYFSNKRSNYKWLICTNNPKARVIERAKKLQIDYKIFTKDELYNGSILNCINSLNPELIILAGFLLKFPIEIINVYNKKIINIHPALLPKYGGKGMYGMNVHKAIIKNKEVVSGITIHYVNKKYGEHRVAVIITFGTLASRAVVRDIGRVLEMPYADVDKLAKLIPYNPSQPLTLKESIKSDKNLQISIQLI